MSSKQSYLPSADLLLKQYIRLAQQFTDAATPQVFSQDIFMIHLSRIVDKS
jgi:hypothetical protein